MEHKMKLKFLKSYLQYFPLFLASFMAFLVFFSKWTGTGPGLVFFAICLFVFPTTSLLAIVLAGNGNRLISFCGATLCYLGFALFDYLDSASNFPKTYDHALGFFFSIAFWATVGATLFGRIAEIYRKSR